MNSLLFIVGPTATGKTDLGITLAKRLNGEIISADSRQVYRGMDIGTGKDIDRNDELRIANYELGINNADLRVGFREKDDVPIWLVDIVEPDYTFNVGEFKHLAVAVIADIQKRGKLPIVVGGTGLYIKSLLEPLSFMSIPPNQDLRESLGNLNMNEMQEKLREVDVTKWQNMNDSDRKNPRRLIRAIEVGLWRKKYKVHSSPLPSDSESGGSLRGDILLIGLTATRQELEKRIELRVEKRVKQGIVEEIQTLLDKGYQWDLPSMSGLGYKEWISFFDSQFDEDKLTESAIKLSCINKWKLHEKQYSKRQMTWFKKMKDIRWFDVCDPEYKESVFAGIEKWYTYKYKYL